MDVDLPEVHARSLEHARRSVAGVADDQWDQLSDCDPWTVRELVNHVVTGNYWADDTDPDLDGDGVRDRPYRISNVFDHLRGNLTAADLFAQGLASDILAQAERAFPVLASVPVLDDDPLARPPALPDVPRRHASDRAATDWLGLAASGLGLAGGLMMLWSGRRPSS